MGETRKSMQVNKGSTKSLSSTTSGFKIIRIVLTEKQKSGLKTTISGSKLSKA
jgi:hypothetical protein